ncbi:MULTISPECIES: hypothetical protein [Halomonas]|uniref:Lipoprotein n=1 Tax=Vreelandella aquamarina TaxID=77097 RepID=A0A857GL48_9GAMM|nr:MULTISPECIES: hypothetical protein [Halomonas]MAO63182.1 hypothetical protein [Halomonas sp.]MDK9687139.1 hypothetical protein [Halomonas sp. LC1]QHD49999.1 hypothetical protein CTT34_10005 [Halomonas meridiana]|tara:strand:- start:393 stop:986 length:594 start_codon:yes stop_codon:yes gene_type:complete
MSFKSSPFWLTALLGTLFVSPLHAEESTLDLPSGAKVGVEVVEALTFNSSQSRYTDLLLHPKQASGTTHSLPEYCLLVANAQLNGDRIRITTQDATCIETHDAESAIYSGEFSASAYAEDGQYGLACNNGDCTLAPGQSFVLTLDESIHIAAQDNPSAEINATRRQANGDGVANPIPGERPDPDQSVENPAPTEQPE